MQCLLLNKFHILTLGEILVCVNTGQSQENESMRTFSFRIFLCFLQDS